VRLTERAGFTLGELTVSLALLGLLVALLLNTLAAHQRIFRNFSQRFLVSEQLRQGKLALATDIRGIAVGADTLRLLSDTAFEFFATIGSSVVCGVAGQIVTLVPENIASGLLLTDLPFPPDTGDLVAAYIRRDSVARTRRWVRFRVSAVTTSPASSACPATTGFTGTSDASKPSFRISIIGATADIPVGAPLRILRRGRYSVYRSSEGEWYLGYKRCAALGGACSTVQPVSGPYLPYSAGTGGGLRFRYLDAHGAPVPSTRPLDVASIEITLRSEVDASGRISGRMIDSVMLIVTPRNLH
jgi:type II secretory pathway pseudopilin PulG